MIQKINLRLPVSLNGITSTYTSVVPIKQSRVRNRLIISSQVVIVPKARRTSYNLAFKIKKVAEAEAVENNSEMALVSVWSVAGGRIKRTFSAVRLNCQRNGRRWDASRRSIRSSIKEY